MSLARAVAVSLAASILLVSGCLPTRDNPHDPNNAPRARLSILDVTTDDGGCPAAGIGTSFTLVSVAFRSDCLALDAAETTDPQGTPLDRLAFTYQIVDGPDPEEAQPIGTPLAIDAGGSYLFGPAVAHGLSASRVYFRVKVEDPSGAVGYAISDVNLLNRAPVVAANAPRTFPVGGHAWDPDATTFAVELNAVATDPDGDEIVGWRWTNADGEELGTAADVTTQVPVADFGRHTFYAYATDGLTESEPAVVPVRVGSPALWAGRFAGGGGLSSVHLLDGDRRLIRETGGFDLTQTNAVRLWQDPNAPETRRVVIASAWSDLILATWPDVQYLDDAFVSGFNEIHALHVSPSGRVWVFDRPEGFAGGYQRELHVFDIVDDALVPVTGLPATVPVEPDFEGTPTVGPDIDGRIAEDLDGNLWIITKSGISLHAFDPALQPLGVWQSPAGSAYQGIAARPGTNEIWVTTGQAYLDDQAGQAAWHVYDGPSAPTVLTLPYVDAREIGWLADGKRFWTSVTGLGLTLVDADALASGSDAALEVVIPTTLAMATLAVDPLTGDAWWGSRQLDAAVRTRVDGSSLLQEDSGVMEFVDPRGVLWFVQLDPAANGGTLAQGLTPGAIRLSRNVFSIGIDSDGAGGIWIANVDPRVLSRIAEDGSEIDSIGELDVGGATRSFPIAFALDADEDRYVWLFGYTEVGSDPVMEILRIDVKAPRAERRRAPAVSAGVVPLSFFTDPEFFLAASPLAGQAHVWLRRIEFDSDIHVAIATPGGTPVDVLEVPMDSTAAAISPLTGDLCVAVLEGSTTDLWRITPAGVATLTTSFTSAVSASVTAAGASAENGEDLCWVAWSEGTSALLRLHAYDEAGARVRTHLDVDGAQTALGAAIRIWPLGSDAVWVMRENEPQRIRFDGPASSTVEAIGTVDGVNYLVGQ